MRAPLRSMFGLALGFAAGLAVAEEAPVVDERASAFACSADTLVEQKRCYLEGEVLPSHDTAAQGKTNAQQAALLATRACAAAARANGAADADLKAACEKEFQSAAAESCTLDGETPVLDEKGRFAPKAGDCYEALGRVVRRTRSMAATTVGCCRCLAKKCSGSPRDTCHRDLFEGEPSAEAKICVQKACAAECATIAAKPEAASEPAKAEKASGGSSIWY